MVVVPSLTSLYPLDFKDEAKALAFSTTLAEYSLKEGSKASPKHTAFPAITCISGPPCDPGKQPYLFLRQSLHHLTKSFLPLVLLMSYELLWLLCVHVGRVRMSPPATSPAMCAISHINMAQIHLLFFSSTQNLLYAGKLNNHIATFWFMPKQPLHCIIIYSLKIRIILIIN